MYLFAADGSERARVALYEKYDSFLEIFKKRRKYDSIEEIEEQFEWLCIWLVSLDKMKAFKKIVNDLGKKYLENAKFFKRFTFDCFYMESKRICGKQRVCNFFEKQCKKSEEVNAFYQTITEEENQQIEEESKEITFEEVVESCIEKERSCFSNQGNIIWFAKTASQQELIRLAKRMLVEEKEGSKANFLVAFRRVAYPLNPEEIILYSKSQNRKLSEIAFEVLARIQNKKVHDYAVSLLKKNRNTTEALSILFYNYKEEDLELAVRTLKSISVNNESCWHGVYSDALDWIRNNRTVPRTLLYYLYDNTRCSVCREYIVREMVKEKVMTDEILEECLYDCNKEIRKYAKRVQRRKKC